VEAERPAATGIAGERSSPTGAPASSTTRRRDLLERPRLLFLCQTLPWPPDGGVWIRTFNVLRMLARAFDVHALCFERTGEGERSGGYSVDAATRALSRYARVETFPIPQAGDRLRFVWDHLRSVASGHVYTRYRYESSAFAERIRALRSEVPFDLVHMDSLDLAVYLPLIGDLPIACVHHNVESALLERRAQVEGGAAGFYYGFQARLMRREERRYTPHLALNVMVSPADREVLLEHAPGARADVVPNGVDVDEFRPEPPQSEDAVVHMGGTNWFPNVDALEHFCEDILPLLRAAGLASPIRWVGSARPEQQAAYRARYDIELTGYLDDVRPAMRDSLCNIVPLRIGGGTRLKILNSWAMGKPVVSTSIGCEGLDARDGENILIRDDPKSFAEAILALRDDVDLRRRIGAAARRTVEEIYSWEVVGARMNDLYRGLLA